MYNNFLLFRPADPLEYLANFLLKNRPAANVEPVTQELQSTSAWNTDIFIRELCSHQKYVIYYYLTLQ